MKSAYLTLYSFFMSLKEIYIMLLSCFFKKSPKGSFIALFAYLLLILSPLIPASAANLTIYSGVSFSDFSTVSQLPEEIDFNEMAGGKLVAIKVTEDLPYNLNLGVEIAAQTSAYAWEAKSDSVFISEEIKTNHIELCINWYPVDWYIMPFAQLGAGVHWGSLSSHFEHGEYLIDDSDGLTRVPGVSLGGGVRIPLHSSLFLQMEVDYSIVKRDNFNGWQVTETDNMNNWKTLFGLGVSL